MKTWLSLWKNTFNYTGTATRKEYWQGILINVVAMYIAIIPYALIVKNFTQNVPLIMTVFLTVVHLPVLSIYFRRAADAGWKCFTTIYVALTLPILSGLLVGVVSRSGKLSKLLYVFRLLMALGFSLFFYSGVLGALLNGDPTSIPTMSIGGLLLMSGSLIAYGIVQWREVLAAFGIYIER